MFDVLISAPQRTPTNMARTVRMFRVSLPRSLNGLKGSLVKSSASSSAPCLFAADCSASCPSCGSLAAEACSSEVGTSLSKHQTKRFDSIGSHDREMSHELIGFHLQVDQAITIGLIESSGASTQLCKVEKIGIDRHFLSLAKGNGRRL